MALAKTYLKRIDKTLPNVTGGRKPVDQDVCVVKIVERVILRLCSSIISPPR